MISQTAEYALRAMVYLTEKPDAAQTISEIARETQTPAGYLSKVMQNLARAGLVSSQRGLGGGFSLTRAAKDISVYDVVQAVDPIARIKRCPLNNPAHAQRLCGLHQSLDQAAAQLEATFRECSLAGLGTSPSFR